MTCRSGGFGERSKPQDEVHYMVASFHCHVLWLMRRPLEMLMLASSQPPRRRPFMKNGLPTASNFLSIPKWFRSGKGDCRRWTPRCQGGEERPLAFLIYSLGLCKFSRLSYNFFLLGSCLQNFTPPTMILMQQWDLLGLSAIIKRKILCITELRKVFQIVVANIIQQPPFTIENLSFLALKILLF
jgi:hypothetical protein